MVGKTIDDIRGGRLPGNTFRFQLPQRGLSIAEMEFDTKQGTSTGYEGNATRSSYPFFRDYWESVGQDTLIPERSTMMKSQPCRSHTTHGNGGNFTRRNTRFGRSITCINRLIPNRKPLPSRSLGDVSDLPYASWVPSTVFAFLIRHTPITTGTRKLVSRR